MQWIWTENFTHLRSFHSIHLEIWLILVNQREWVHTKPRNDKWKPNLKISSAGNSRKSNGHKSTHPSAIREGRVGQTSSTAHTASTIHSTVSWIDEDSVHLENHKRGGESNSSSNSLDSHGRFPPWFCTETWLKNLVRTLCSWIASSWMRWSWKSVDTLPFSISKPSLTKKIRIVSFASVCNFQFCSNC